MRGLRPFVSGARAPAPNQRGAHRPGRSIEYQRPTAWRAENLGAVAPPRRCRRALFGRTARRCGVGRPSLAGQAGEQRCWVDAQRRRDADHGDDGDVDRPPLYPAEVGAVEPCAVREVLL